MKQEFPWKIFPIWLGWGDADLLVYSFRSVRFGSGSGYIGLSEYSKKGIKNIKLVKI